MEVVTPKTQKVEAKVASNMQVIVFKLGGEEYGIPIDSIKEVVLTPPVTRIPLAPRYIKGVANVRGTILAIVDLEERLSLNLDKIKEETQKPNYLLVIESEDYKMGVLVKEVPNTLSVSEANIDHSPNLVQDGSIEKGYVRGIVKTESRLVILVDVFKLVTKDDVAVS